MPNEPTICDEMKNARISALPQFPERNGQDDKAYRQQLIEYYNQLRKLQFQYTVKNEGMKLYNGIGISRRNSNDILWLKPEKQPQCIADTAANRSYELMDRANQTHLSSGNPTCAIAANSLSDQICHKMGFDPLISGRGTQVTAGSCLASSENTKNIIQEMCNSADPSTNSRGQYIKKLNATSGTRAWVKKGKEWVPGNSPAVRKSISDLIEQGILQPGDAFGHESKTNSGSHAVTLVDVVKDDNGKIVGYTLQACNQTKYKYYDIKAGRSLKVTNIAPLSYYAQSQIDNEAARLKDVNIDELEHICQNTQQNTMKLIQDLYETEEDNRTLTIPSSVENINRNLYVGSKGYNRELLYVQSQIPPQQLEETKQSESTNLTSQFEQQYTSSQSPNKADELATKYTKDDLTKVLVNAYEDNKDNQEKVNTSNNTQQKPPIYVLKDPNSY